MRAERLKLSFFAPYKFSGRQTVNRSEIPHYAYTWPLAASVKDTNPIDYSGLKTGRTNNFER